MAVKYAGLLPSEVKLGVSPSKLRTILCRLWGESPHRGSQVRDSSAAFGLFRGRPRNIHTPDSTPDNPTVSNRPDLQKSPTVDPSEPPEHSSCPGMFDLNVQDPRRCGRSVSPGSVSGWGYISVGFLGLPYPMNPPGARACTREHVCACDCSAAFAPNMNRPVVAGTAVFV